MKLITYLNREYHMASSFWEGVSSSFDLFGSARKKRSSLFTADIGEYCYHSLQKDWDNVGKDIAEAIQVLEHGQKTG